MFLLLGDTVMPGGNEAGIVMRLGGQGRNGGPRRVALATVDTEDGR